ncbi:phage major capsid protein [Advenella sp. WQ 585]|uniref:Phage major capsid protein n=1 Tax=Advenella mandrilli TaxID=2800330 RepID=A0ABS1EF25_9BURK|nr:phage major capsid protein [Advenella mandrilli]MBK1780567.1 phage major capsid protein [Advenella mandrilli]
MAHHNIQRGIVSVRAQSDVNQIVANLQKAFSDFQAEHKKQLDDVKAGLPASDHEEKLSKFDREISSLQAAVDEANLKIASAQMGGPAGGIKDKEYTEAFKAHMKKGDIQAALNKGADDEGGYLTPTEWDRTITDKLVQVSPMRQIAGGVSTSKNAYTKLFNVGGTASGWVGEADARTETATSEFAPLTITTGEIYANPAATQQILDDAEINLESWLAGEVQTEFAKQEGAAFVSGDGSNKPFGILTYVTGATNAAKHPFGAITLVKSGNANLLTADGIIDLVYDLPSAFTGNARFIMNRKTMAAARKLKDGSGTYLWQPSYLAGQPSTLAGFAVTEVPDMPDVAANAKPIMFGDFRQGYLIVDRVGVRVLRDPYTKKPYVLFYTTKRVGGGVVNPECLRALNVAA